VKSPGFDSYETNLSSPCLRALVEAHEDTLNSEYQKD